MKAAKTYYLRIRVIEKKNDLEKEELSKIWSNFHKKIHGLSVILKPKSDNVDQREFSFRWKSSSRDTFKLVSAHPTHIVTRAVNPALSKAGRFVMSQTTLPENSFSIVATLYDSEEDARDTAQSLKAVD